MEDVHLPIAQAGFQQQAQQLVTGKGRATMGNQVYHDHFQHRLGLAVALGLSFRLLLNRFLLHRPLLHRRLRRLTGRFRLLHRFPVLRGRGLIRRFRLPLAVEQALLFGGGRLINDFVRLHHGGRRVGLLLRVHFHGPAHHAGGADQLRVVVAFLGFFFLGIPVTRVDTHTQSALPFPDHTTDAVGQDQQDQNNQNANQCFQIQAHRLIFLACLRCTTFDGRVGFFTCSRARVQNLPSPPTPLPLVAERGS